MPPNPLTLDVVLPTYNRQELLQLTLASLARAAVPEGLTIRVLVVDNNCRDQTAQIVETMARDFPLPLERVLETKQGLSNARNGGIAAGSGELIGFLDDDEEVAPHWFQVIAREFAEPAVEFIGGPYLPNWVTPVPDWLPPGYHSAIGAVPPKPRSPFGAEFGANLMGGNAVIRRRVFERVGLYAPHLGRSGKGLLSEEDAEFLRRMMAAGVQGTYVPELEILHYIAPDRLTRAYHRRWVYWRAVSQGVLDRTEPQRVSYLFGVPRHLLGRAVRGALRIPARLTGKASKGEAFAGELDSWNLLGFFYGKHLIRIEKLYPDKK